MPPIIPKKKVFKALPTTKDDGEPRYLLAKMNGRVEKDTWPGAPADRKKWNVQFDVMEPDLDADAKIWKSYGYTISHSSNTKRVSDLTFLIIALDPTQTRESLDDGYDPDTLNGKLVKIRVEDYIKQDNTPGQKVTEVRLAKGKQAVAQAKKVEEKGIEI